MGERQNAILHRLTADSTFLLQVPQPPELHAQVHRKYFNILIDPWLQGSQTDYSRLLSKQWHRETPVFKSLSDIADLTRNEEQQHAVTQDRTARIDAFGNIDAVFILHEFSDHMHQATLLDLHPEIPIFATPVAATHIHSWGHFQRISVIPDFPATHEGNWQAISAPLLPSFLRVARLSMNDVGYLHSALLITFALETSTSASAQAVIYTPHGIPPFALAPLKAADPPVSTLCLIHGLDKVDVGPLQINLGVKNALLLQRELRPKYWVPCHDERKYRSGIVGWMLKQEEGKVEEAVTSESDKLSGKDERGAFVELRNGGRLVLQ